MTDPLPNCRSICDKAAESAFLRFSSILFPRWFNENCDGLSHRKNRPHSACQLLFVGSIGWLNFAAEIIL
jgi:hypothetical protein